MKKRSRMVLRVGTVVLMAVLVLGGMAGVGGLDTARSQSDACTTLVTQAVDVIGTSCAMMGRNEACYGHTLVAATFQDGAAGVSFEKSGDIAPLLDLQALVTRPADPEAGTWGVAMLKVQADLPDTGDQALTFVLFGDTEVTNGVDPEQASLPTCTITNAGGGINVRSGPGTSYGIVNVLESGGTAVANGRNAAGDWLRVDLEDGPGWVYVPLVTVDGDINTLAVIEEGAEPAPVVRPMQVFTLRSGENDTCAEAPDGLLIQSPGGQRAHVSVNGVEMEFASAGFLTAVPDDALTVSGIEGSIAVTAFGKTVTVEPGFKTDIPLEGLEASGPPEDPQVIDEFLTVPGLQRAVAYGEPLDFSTAGEIIMPSVSRFTSGDYTETCTITDLVVTNDCYWNDHQGNPVQMGDVGVYDVTITFSEDGSSIVYGVEGESYTFEYQGSMTYSAAISHDTAVWEPTLTFTSPTTYDWTSTSTVTSGECAGITMTSVCTGVAK
ncbi:MAG: SH3 domain-containing protein [Anaerolineae bacterium]|nr:SH3 domain-containing protein [Anaerolineae bacterium]